MQNTVLQQASLSGQFRIEIKRNGQIIKETDWFDNLITNNGLGAIACINRLGVNSYIRCVVGSGTNAPAITDMLLGQRVGTWSGAGDTTYANTGVPNYTQSYINKFTFTQGSIVGNITEVGTVWSPSGSSYNLFSRALITDINGNPVVLTLLAIDQLIIYYKLNVALPLSISNNSVQINGVTYNYTSRYIYLLNSFSTNFPYYGMTYSGGVTCGFCGSYGFVPGDQTKNYVSPEYIGGTMTTAYVDGSYTGNYKSVASISMANWIGGVKALHVTTTFGKNCIVFDTPIMKTDTQVLTINTSVNWNRV